MSLKVELELELELKLKPKVKSLEWMCSLQGSESFVLTGVVVVRCVIFLNQ